MGQGGQATEASVAGGFPFGVPSESQKGGTLKTETPTFLRSTFGNPEACHRAQSPRRLQHGLQQLGQGKGRLCQVLLQPANGPAARWDFVRDFVPKVRT